MSDPKPAAVDPDAAGRQRERVELTAGLPGRGVARIGRPDDGMAVGRRGLRRLCARRQRQAGSRLWRASQAAVFTIACQRGQRSRVCVDRCFAFKAPPGLGVVAPRALGPGRVPILDDGNMP